MTTHVTQVKKNLAKTSQTGAQIVGNVTTKFRDAFENYVPNVLYKETKASGDIIVLDGNTAGASYLTISKSPWNVGTESILETIANFNLPIELSIGAHRSQAVAGQEFSVEIVDSDTQLPVYTEVAVSSMSQSGTTLTVNTATAHGLSIGMSIGIYGCADSRFNYGSVVVATVPSTTQFTVTAGPTGTIQTLTASPAVLGSPFVYVRRRLGGANDGTSMIFENASATNASFYVRSESGDAFPSGTIAGNHTVTVGTTASVQLVNSPYAFAFAPTTEYRLNLSSDRVQWHDSAVDVATGTTQRILRTSVCPSLDKSYKLRIRATNNKGLAAPVGKIVSAAKTGTTTATVTFASAHGLTVNDYVTIYGSRDQTNFPNITAATQVASVVNATTITIIWGAAVTATTYGGYVARVQAGLAVPGTTQVGSSVSITNSIVTLTGNAAWSGLSIGDSVELIGVRADLTGNDLLIDGAYEIRNVTGTTLELQAMPGTVPPTTLTSTNCGGGVLKRTDFRVSFIRIFDYERERVEFTPRPQSDLTVSLPVQVTNTPTVTATNLSTNVNQIGGVAPAAGISSGSTNNTLSVNTASAISSTDQNATAFAGAGRVNGTVVASARGGSAVISAEINVSALTLGTATSVVFVLQESSGGTNFTDIWFSDPITAAGIVRVPPISVGGRRRWCAHSVGGTSTTVTATITALELPPGYPVIRQYRDAFSATNPLSSVINSATGVATTLVSTGATCMTATTQATAPMVIEGCKISTLHLVLTGTPTVTTQPVLALEFSQDGTNWFTSTATVTATGAGVYSASIATVAFRFARIRVTTAAVYSAGNYTIGSVGITSIS